MKKDGKVTGKGLENDPYIIIAHYYYYRGLNEKIISGFREAMNDYNQGGKIWKIKGDNKTRVYVKFELSFEEKDTSLLKEEILSPDYIDSLHHFGNMVLAMSDNQEAYGQGGNFVIAMDIDKIRKDVYVLGMTGLGSNEILVEQLIKGVFIHEIGHNLGGNHSDGYTMMRSQVPKNILAYEAEFHSCPDCFSKVDSRFLRILVSRIDSPYCTGYEKDKDYQKAFAAYLDSLKNEKINKSLPAPQRPDSCIYEGTSGKLFSASSLKSMRTIQ
ncbi:zinc-dependent metalloprotease family protein [Flavitalea flava]